MMRVPQSMAMPWTYLICLLAGGVLITLSIAGDSDGIADVDGASGIADMMSPQPFDGVHQKGSSYSEN